MIILSTDSLKGYGLNRIFELTKLAGYDGIDLQVNYGQYDTINTQYLKKLISDYNLPVQSVSAPDRVSAKHVKEIVLMAKELSAKVVIIQPPKLFEFKLSNWLKKEIPKLREKEFISIALENAPAGTFLGIIPDHAMANTDELKKFKHVSLDTARLGEKRQDLMRAYNAFKKYLVHVHLSNFHHGKKYAPPQEGIMPMESFLTKLKQDRYPGAIAIKVLPKYLHVGEDDKRVVDALQEIKEYHDKYFTNVESRPEEPEEVDAENAQG